MYLFSKLQFNYGQASRRAGQAPFKMLIVLFWLLFHIPNTAVRISSLTWDCGLKIKIKLCNLNGKTS